MKFFREKGSNKLRNLDFYEEGKNCGKGINEYKIKYYLIDLKDIYLFNNTNSG